MRIFEDFIVGFVEGFTAEHKRLSALLTRPVEVDELDDAEPIVEEEDEVADTLILEVVERAHERFASRLDALDTVLVGLMAAILAIGAIAIDQYTDLKPSLIWFVGSLACCAFGWLLGNIVWPVREPVSPSYFLGGIAEQGAEALPEITAAIARSYERRKWIRVAKLLAVAIAMTCLLVGVLMAVHSESVVN